VLAEGIIPALREHLANVRLTHQENLAAGYGAVYLPGALDRKYPAAAREWGWQYVFPARDLSTDPRSGVVRRHHLDEATINKAIKAAVARVGTAMGASWEPRRRLPVAPLIADKRCYGEATASIWCGPGGDMETTANGREHRNIQHPTSDIQPRVRIQRCPGCGRRGSRRGYSARRSET
jgi:hypothetical protein